MYGHLGYIELSCIPTSPLTNSRTTSICCQAPSSSFTFRLDTKSSPKLQGIQSQNWFLARVLAKALKMLFCILPDMFNQIFHFFHIFNFWWNNHWNISSDFQSSIFFWSDWIRSVKNGSNLIKLNFWGNNHWYIYHHFFNFIHLLIRLNQICPKLWI